jgi:predicted nucleic acid-binding protein
VQAEVGISADWLTVRAVQNLAVVASLKTQIDDGEAEAISLAMELGDVFIILDDRNARRIAATFAKSVETTAPLPSSN